jgi:hypothetical protein
MESRTEGSIAPMSLQLQQPDDADPSPRSSKREQCVGIGGRTTTHKPRAVWHYHHHYDETQKELIYPMYDLFVGF